ncbi:MAG: YaaL family protein [Bacillota bacterium]
MGQPWDRLRSLFRTGGRDGSSVNEPAGDPPVDELVWQAQRELEAAQAYFESVSDPDLVDHACYLLEAAQKRYSYLLRLARQGRIAG